MENYLRESAVLLAVFWLLYRLFLVREKYFTFNRFYLLLSSLAALLIPALPEFTSSSAEIPLGQVLILDEMMFSGADAAIQKTTESSWDWQAGLLWIYAAGIAVSGLLFFRNLAKPLQVIRTSEIRPAGSFFIVPTGGKLPTFAFFRFLFWDDTDGLSEDEKQKIFKHEVAHIQGLHSWDVIYTELIKIFFWFNPFVYLYAKSLRDQHEFIADRAACPVTDRADYSRLMIKAVFKDLDLNYAHGFAKSQIQKRLAMLHKNQFSRLGKWKAFAATASLLLTATVFSCSDMVYPDGLSASGNNVDVVNLDEYIAENLVYPDFAPKEEINGRVELRIINYEHGFSMWTKNTTDERLERAAMNIFSWPGKDPEWMRRNPLLKNALVVVKFGNGQGDFIPHTVPGAHPSFAESLEKQRESLKDINFQPTYPAENLDNYFRQVNESIRYPNDLKKADIPARVRVSIFVNSEGSPEIVDASTDYPELSQAIEAAIIKQGKWLPAIDKAGKNSWMGTNMVLELTGK